VPTDGSARVAVLYPAVAEAAHRAAAEAVALVDLGAPPGLDLELDRVGITYSDGRRLGDAAAAVQLTARVVGGRPVPGRALPPVVPRVSKGPAPGPTELEEQLADAVGHLPEGALPVVVTTWALSRLAPEGRLRFLQRLDDVAADRPLAWVSVEGVGVAPGVPTLGDRRASGHSIVGVAVLDHASLRVEAVGRCWSRGSQLVWLAGS
jgi:hypothetical protein